MMEIFSNILMIAAIGIAAITVIFLTIVYFHDKSLRKRQLIMSVDYEREYAWQKARDEELAMEQHNARLDEINRDYLDAIKAIEIMEELEGDKNDLR